MRINSRHILLVGKSGRELWESAIMLTRFGHEVHIAESGRSGFEKAGNNDFDLICVRNGLPDLEGLDFIASLTPDQRKKVIYFLREGECPSEDLKELEVYEVISGFPKIPELAVIVCDFFIRDGIKTELFEETVII